MANNNKKQSNNKQKSKQNGKAGNKNTKAQAKSPSVPKQPMPRGISAIILIAIGAFLIISLQTDLAGVLGSFIATFLKGLGGITGYMVPYILIVYAVLQIFGVVKPVNILKFIELFGFHLSFILMNSARYVKNNAAGSPGFKEIYQQGADLEGGGLLGMYLGPPVYKLAGMAGLLILAAALLVIFTMLLAGGKQHREYHDAACRRQRLGQIQ